MNYQYSTSNKYIAICNTPDLLKIHQISDKECILLHTFPLSNIFKDLTKNTRVKKIHWIGDDIILVWIKHNKEARIAVFDVNRGVQAGSIELEDDEDVISITGSNNKVVVFKKVGNENNQLKCIEYSIEGKEKSKIKIGRWKDCKSCIAQDLNNDEMLFFDGSSLRCKNITTRKETFRIKTEKVGTVENLGFVGQDSKIIWMRNNTNRIGIYSVEQEKMIKNLLMEEDAELIQTVINYKEFLLVSYETKLSLYQIVNDGLSIKTLSTFTTESSQDQEQYLLGGCIDGQHIHFCFYERNLDQVRSERIRFQDENNEIVLPSIVNIGDKPKEDGTATTITSDGKPVSSLSQAGPKRALETDIITAPTKRPKVATEDDDDGLTIHQILQNQLDKKQETYIATLDEEGKEAAEAKYKKAPSTQSLSTILTQALTSHDQSTFHETIINNTTPTVKIMQHTIASLDSTLLPLFLRKLTQKIQSNYRLLGSITPWIREIMFYSCTYKEELPMEVKKELHGDLLLWRSVAEKRIREYDSFVGLSARLDKKVVTTRR